MELQEQVDIKLNKIGEIFKELKNLDHLRVTCETNEDGDLLIHVKSDDFHVLNLPIPAFLTYESILDYAELIKKHIIYGKTRAIRIVLTPTKGKVNGT